MLFWSVFTVPERNKSSHTLQYRFFSLRHSISWSLSLFLSARSPWHRTVTRRTTQRWVGWLKLLYCVFSRCRRPSQSPRHADASQRSSSTTKGRLRRRLYPGTSSTGRNSGTFGYRICCGLLGANFMNRKMGWMGSFIDFFRVTFGKFVWAWGPCPARGSMSNVDSSRSTVTYAVTGSQAPSTPAFLVAVSAGRASAVQRGALAACGMASPRAHTHVCELCPTPPHVTNRNALKGPSTSPFSVSSRLPRSHTLCSLRPLPIPIITAPGSHHLPFKVTTSHRVHPKGAATPYPRVLASTAAPTRCNPRAFGVFTRPPPNAKAS